MELTARPSDGEPRVRDAVIAKAEAVENPDLAAEIGALRISAILLRSVDRPNHAVIDFEGADEMRYWSCEFVDGEPSGLRFDT
jgi:hypothetical protein